MTKAKRTRWLPAGWGIVCANRIGGTGWRFEAHLGLDIRRAVFVLSRGAWYVPEYCLTPETRAAIDNRKENKP